MSLFKRTSYMPVKKGLKSGINVLDIAVADWRSFTKSLRYQKQRYVLSEEANNIPLIAFKEYGRSDLWWVLARANNIISPLSDMPAGMIIRIPSIESITRGLNLLKTSIVSSDSGDSSQVTFPRNTP